MKERGLSRGALSLVRAITAGLLATSLAACSAAGGPSSLRSNLNATPDCQSVEASAPQALRRVSRPLEAQEAAAKPPVAAASLTELPPQTSDFPAPAIPEIPAYTPHNFYKGLFSRDRQMERRDRSWDSADMGRGHDGPVRLGKDSIFDNLLVTAFVQVGTDYRSGGSAPTSGFDCSGFTSWVFEQVGVNLPRSSGEQFSVGKAIPVTDLKKGDLVFFRRKKRISHVGIYVKNGSFIHSPRPGSAVKVSNLAEPAWSKQFAGARRILP